MLKIVDSPYQIDTEYYTSKLKAVTKDLNIRGTICIKLGSIEEARQLNLTYRKRNYPTDVLSFPLNEQLPDGFYVGDIFICYPLAQDQARENHLNLEQELLTLMLHGILHLVGYDHETDSGEMAALQEKLLKGETK